MRLIIELDDGEEIEVLDDLEDYHLDNPFDASVVSSTILEIMQQAQERRSEVQP